MAAAAALNLRSKEELPDALRRSASLQAPERSMLWAVPATPGLPRRGLRAMPEGQATPTAEELALLRKHRAEADAVDCDLVSKAQSGDREALGELLRKHGPGLYRSVL